MFYRKLLALLFLMAAILASVIPVSAHPGRTDENGGHVDSSTGEYHYHHGYSAHQHEDGKCPYDFDDKTGLKSGTPSSGTKKDSAISSTSPFVPYTSPTVSYSYTPKEAKGSDDEVPVFIVIGIVVSLGIVIAVMMGKISSKDSEIYSLSRRIDSEEKAYESKLEELKLRIESVDSLEKQYEAKIEKLILQLGSYNNIKNQYESKIWEMQLQIKDLEEKLSDAAEEKEQLLNRIQQNESERLDDKRKEINGSLKDKLRYEFGDQYLLKLSGAPENIIFDSDGFPHRYVNDRDQYTFYVGSTNRYHTMNCRYAMSARKVHAFEVIEKKYHSCGLCYPILPDLSWYKRYISYMKRIDYIDDDRELRINWREPNSNLPHP